MSGGYFDYENYKISYIIDSVDSLLRNIDNYNFKNNDKLKEEFKNGLIHLKIASIYAHRIDWLMSGDDGEETFFERLEEDLKSIAHPLP